MALISWPSTSIMTNLHIVSAQFYLGRGRELSRSRSTTYRKDLSDPVWLAKLQSCDLYHDEALAKQALINTMEDQLETFYVWNPVRPYPLYDFDGSKYLTSAPVVLVKDADNKRLSIGGLVAGYTITIGDFIAIPTRNCLLQVVAGSVADGSGHTGLIEVSPFIRTAVTAGDAILLIKPYMEAMLVPGQDDFIESSGAFSRLSFSVMQVL